MATIGRVMGREGADAMRPSTSDFPQRPMNGRQVAGFPRRYRWLVGFALAVTIAAGTPAIAAPRVAAIRTAAAVTLRDDGDSWTLDNGIVRMSVLKANGNIKQGSLVYRGVSIVPGHSEFWETTPAGTITARVTIDPRTNGGERAEIAVKGVNPGGGAVGAGGRIGLGGPTQGGMDIEVRYALERGTSGFYTTAEYTHKASYPTSGFGENRFILQMNPTFDWLSVDDDRNMLMTSGDDLAKGVVVHAKEQRILSSGLYANSVEHKYSYNAVMYKLKAWGWSSTSDHVGVWFINPSTEYIGGGAEKLDLIDHMGATVLDYWTSGHYAGGAGNSIPAGEDWTRVVGPIFVYFNALDHADAPGAADIKAFEASKGSGEPTPPRAWRDNALALWHDAVDRSRAVKAAWPYDWVTGLDYPHRDDRGAVTGRLVLDDPQATTTALPHLTVGLAHPDYQADRGGYQTRYGTGNTVTWPHDGNYYQFWADGSADGRFAIRNVRPGRYTLHAFADGVLGEYARAEIVVGAGGQVDLGDLAWRPVRYGRQVWDIGYPDRTGDKFYKGDGANYWLWGWPLRYGKLFPHDVTYTIGQSDYHHDWFFAEVPHATSEAWANPAATDLANQRFGWVRAESLARYPQTDHTGPWRIYGTGRATTWTVNFTMPARPQGTAVLRVALAGADGLGTDTAGLAIGVNGSAVGAIHPVATNALRYNTDKGVWYQYSQAFDARLLRSGANTLTFTVPAGDLTTGVVWDYVRLELDDGHGRYPVAPANGRPDMPALAWPIPPGGRRRD